MRPAILSTSLALSLFPALALADLRIVHFEVGMGDSTLIVDTESGQSLLVDAGNRGYDGSIVAPSLRALGIDRLTYFPATHHDADHIGGFDEIAPAGISVDQAVLHRGNYTDRKLTTATGRPTRYGEYVLAAGQLRRVVEPSCDPSAEAAITLGGGTRIEVVTARIVSNPSGRRG